MRKWKDLSEPEQQDVVVFLSFFLIVFVGVLGFIFPELLFVAAIYLLWFLAGCVVGFSVVCLVSVIRIFFKEDHPTERKP